MLDSTKLGDALAHPYFPAEAHIANYLANEWEVIPLVTAFLGGWGALLLLTHVVVSYVSPKLRIGDRIAVLWFVFSTY
jgi:cholestenol delta-isomerase